MIPTAATTRTRTVEQTLRRLAAWGLDGTEPIEAIEPIVDPVVGASLVEHARHERLTGVLALAADAGAIDLPAAVVEQAHQAHREALVWCLRLEVHLLHLAEILRADGIEPVVLKGPASAHLDAIEPSIRPFADLDLLIAAADVDRAVALVAADGGVRPWAERRPGFDRRFAKSVTLRTPDGVEVDLHRSLVDGALGTRIPLARLHADAVRFEVGGTDLLALSPVHRVLHTAYHLVLGSRVPRLMSLRDLATHLTDPGVARDAVLAESARWGGDAVLAEAVRLSVVTLGVAAPRWEAWADGVTTTPRQRAVLDRQRAEGSALGRAKLDALVAVPGWRDRAAYAFALAAPSRAHLRSRNLRRRDLVRRR